LKGKESSCSSPAAGEKEIWREAYYRRKAEICKTVGKGKAGCRRSELFEG